MGLLASQGSGSCSGFGLRDAKVASEWRRLCSRYGPGGNWLRPLEACTFLRLQVFACCMAHSETLTTTIIQSGEAPF